MCVKHAQVPTPECRRAVGEESSRSTPTRVCAGGGSPSLQKALMPTVNQPFETIMQAIASNSRNERGNGQIVLLIERPQSRDV